MDSGERPYKPLRHGAKLQTDSEKKLNFIAPVPAVPAQAYDTPPRSSQRAFQGAAAYADA
jgi:hypothetical protein